MECVYYCHWFFVPICNGLSNLVDFNAKNYIKIHFGIPSPPPPPPQITRSFLPFSYLNSFNSCGKGILASSEKGLMNRLTPSTTSGLINFISFSSNFGTFARSSSPSTTSTSSSSTSRSSSILDRFLLPLFGCLPCSAAALSVADLPMPLLPLDVPLCSDSLSCWCQMAPPFTIPPALFWMLLPLLAWLLPFPLVGCTITLLFRGSARVKGKINVTYLMASLFLGIFFCKCDFEPTLNSNECL